MHRVLAVVSVGILGACTDSPAPVKRVFTTSGTHDASFGGLAGGDTLCKSAADAATAAGLGDLGSATWVAWLSDTNTDAIDRIADVGPWYRVDGTTKVFNNKAHVQLAPAQLLAPILTDERGNPHDVTWNVWTGTMAGGVRSMYHCVNWTNNSSASNLPPYDGRAEGGNTARTTDEWTSASPPNDVGGTHIYPCNATLALICFEQ